MSSGKVIRTRVRARRLASRRLFRTVAWLAFAVVAFVGLQATAGATTVRRFTLDQVTRTADLVVLGQAGPASSRWDARHSAIYTYTTIYVAERWKGALEQREIQLRQKGGTVGQVHLHVAGVSYLQPGTEVVLFLFHNADDGSYSLVGMWQGLMPVERDARTGESFVRPPVVTATLDTRTNTYTQDAPLQEQLGAFRDEVQRRAAGAGTQ